MRKGNLQAQAAVLCDFMSQFRHPYELTPFWYILQTNFWNNVPSRNLDRLLFFVAILSAFASAKPLSLRWASWHAVEVSPGLVGTLWLSLQDYIRYVLTFSVLCAAFTNMKRHDACAKSLCSIGSVLEKLVIALPWRSYKSVPKKFSKTSLDQLFSIVFLI